MSSYLDRLRSLALAYDGAFEDHPFGPEPVFKARNKKIFVFTGGEGPGGSLSVSLKLTPPEAAEALTLPFVKVAPYVGRYGWVSVAITTDIEWDIAEPWLHRSYELVAGPKKRPAR